MRFSYVQLLPRRGIQCRCGTLGIRRTLCPRGPREIQDWQETVIPQFRHQDSNLDKQDQNLSCCQLHHGGMGRARWESLSSARPRRDSFRCLAAFLVAIMRVYWRWPSCE